MSTDPYHDLNADGNHYADFLKWRLDMAETENALLRESMAHFKRSHTLVNHPGTMLACFLVALVLGFFIGGFVYGN